MPSINFLVPRLHPTKFSGGVWCIFPFAQGLTIRGHRVTVTPVLPSPEPEWLPARKFPVVSTGSKEQVGETWKSFTSATKKMLVTRRPPLAEIRHFTEQCALLVPAAFSDLLRSGLSEAYVRTVAPHSDIHVATGYETARPLSLLSGQKFYFAQHFEPVFAGEAQDPVASEAIARQSYHLGFNLIANSSWLLNQLRTESPEASVTLCPNAIDHSNFTGVPKKRSGRDVVVISYGGRRAEWKGFRDMAHAVAIARAAEPNRQIEWRVYGDSLLPPRNSIASYTPLGFLNPEQLSRAYREADILLSASWYESFPLFPIEAMACGLAVVTTQPGTEEFAEAGKTAEIVEPRNPQAIAEGLLRLVRDPDYRYRIASCGQEKSREFTWDRSVSRMESILLGMGS